MSNYYTVSEMYGEKFYQVPKVFFTNPLYKDGLTPLEKLAFGLLKDRFSLSVKNGWFDEEGRIYFIFTQENLMEIFDCSKQTASNVKKNLIKVGLLEVKRRGQGRADLLYLKRPIVTDNDIYKIDATEDTSKISVETLDNAGKSKNKTSRSPEIRLQEVLKIDANDTDLNNTNLTKPLLSIDNYQDDIKNAVDTSAISKEKAKIQDPEVLFTDSCNEFYSTFAIGRWSKKQWDILVKAFVTETIEAGRHEKIPEDKIMGYCYKALATIAENGSYKKFKNEEMFVAWAKNDEKKRERVIQTMLSPHEEADSHSKQNVPPPPFYNWLEERD